MWTGSSPWLQFNQTHRCAGASITQSQRGVQMKDWDHRCDQPRNTHSHTHKHSRETTKKKAHTKTDRQTHRHTHTHTHTNEQYWQVNECGPLTRTCLNDERGM